MAREFRLDRDEVTAQAVWLLLEAKARGYTATRLNIRQELAKWSKRYWREQQYLRPLRVDDYDGARTNDTDRPGLDGLLGFHSADEFAARPVFGSPSWVVLERSWAAYAPRRWPADRPIVRDLRLNHRGKRRIEEWREPCPCDSCLALRTFYEKRLGSPYPLERMTLDPTDPGVMVHKHSHGATYEEIGKDAGITKGAARKRVDGYLDKIGVKSTQAAERIPCCEAPPCAASRCCRSNFARFAKIRPWGINRREGLGPFCNTHTPSLIRARPLPEPQAKSARLSITNAEERRENQAALARQRLGLRVSYSTTWKHEPISQAERNSLGPSQLLALRLNGLDPQGERAFNAVIWLPAHEVWSGSPANEAFEEFKARHARESAAIMSQLKTA